MGINKDLSNNSHLVIRNEPNKNMKTKEFGAPMDLCCDICHSQDIKETREGYVCRSCGIVLEVQKLEYHRPYDSNILQYAPLGTTQIGTPKERFQNSHSRQLNKLNKFQSFIDNKTSVLISAKYEMGRIFDILHLPSSIKPMVIKKYEKIRAYLHPGTKYRTPEKLIPITIYFVCKAENISINERELLEISKISKKEFNHFKLQILQYLPKYKERNRKQYILQKILEISEHFKLGMDFFHQAKFILYKLWDSINSTKDDVIAGVVSCISLLCIFNNSEVSVNSVCTKLGIKMSTIQFQVKKRIFEHFCILGFTTLIQSKDLLRNVMEKMGLLKYSAIDNSEGNVLPDLVEVELGGGVPIRPHTIEDHIFLYAIRQRNNEVVIISGISYFINSNFSRVAHGRPIAPCDKDSVLKLKLLKYIMGKGPPLNNCLYS